MPQGGRGQIPFLSNEYLDELHRFTRFRSLKAALWAELRRRRHRRLFGRHGRIARLLHLG